jgi:tetratricopeptide (TPR) repeat protein
MEFDMRNVKYWRLLPVTVLLFTLLPWAAAQQGGGGGNTTTSDTGKSNPKVPARPSIGGTPSQTQRPQQIDRRPVFISGEVQREDGSPPPFGAAIELDCRGLITKQTMVNGMGGFSFQVGDKNRFGQLMPDASEPYFQDSFNRNPLPGSENDPSAFRGPIVQPSIRLAGCELRANLAGYHSSTIRFNMEPEPGPNDVGTIVIYPIGRVKGTTISASSLLAPKEAMNSLSRAKKALKKEKYGEAEEYLKSATAVYPQYGEAWFELGKLYHGRSRNEEARAAYLKAIETDGFYLGPYIGLGWLASGERKWQEAADFTERALELDPFSFPEIYFINALANCNLYKLDVAEKSARQLQRLDPKHHFPKIFLVLSNIYTLRNDEPASIEEMRNYLKYAPKAPDADTIKSLLEKKIAQARAK